MVTLWPKGHEQNCEHFGRDTSEHSVALETYIAKMSMSFRQEVGQAEQST